MNAQERIDAAIAARPQATPGPWMVDVFEGNEIIVANGTFLAKLWLRKNWDTESNATLIAAAPDLADEVVRLRKWQQEALPWLAGSLILWDIETKLRSDYKYTDLPEPVIDYIEKLRDQIAEWKAEYHLPEEEAEE